MGGPTSPVPWASYSVGDVLYWNGTSFVRLAAGTAGQALLTGGAGVAPSWGSAGVTAHNGLTGLADDDHPQYALADGSRGSFAATGHNHAGVYLPIAGKAADSDLLDGLDSTAFALSGHSHSAPAHSALSGLSADDHSQYALLAGRSGGQTIIGGTASGDDLYLLASTQTGNPAAGVYRTVYIGSDPSAPGTYGIAVSRNGDGGGAGVSVNVMVGAGWNDTFKLTTVGTKYLDWQTGVWTTAGANYNTFAAGGATHVPLAVKGAASQSANLQEWQNSSGTVLASIDSAGQLFTPRVTWAASHYAEYNSANVAIQFFTSSTKRAQLGQNGVDTFNAGSAQTARIATSGASWFQAPSAGVVPLTIYAAPAQTADLFDAMNSGSVIQFAIGAAGKIMTNQASANTNTPSGATAQKLAIYDTAGTLLGYIPVYASAW